MDFFCDGHPQTPRSQGASIEARLGFPVGQGRSHVGSLSLPPFIAERGVRYQGVSVRQREFKELADRAGHINL